MAASTMRTFVIAVAIVASVTCVSKLVLGSAQLEQIGSLSNNEGIVVDIKTFKIARGVASGDPSARLVMLNAKLVAEGAIVFRTGDKLYIVDAQPDDTPQAMRGNWPPQTIDDFNSIFTTRMR